ncbi:MAG: Crp/Fnr family transcriptional regulator [Alphaproteobacteria bacterium]|nr:Crp/Fnr family transcriptional regulator [Alphaproteobacteria bacterium]
MTIPDWLVDGFPDLSRLEDEPMRLLARSARRIEVPAGTVLFSEGAECSSYVLVLAGSILVRKVSENGREIVLYRVERGQSCVLTTSCLMTRADYAAEGIAETPVGAAVVPAATFQTLLGLSARFRDFVFSAYATRIADLLMLIEEVAFGRIDLRLAQALLAQRDERGEIRGTHQDLAVELGTAREVVSRQLKEFERRGWLALHRGRIEVLAPAALAEMARKEK